MSFIASFKAARVKYGALSCSQGHVNVRCCEIRDGALRLTWQETSGPPVVVPSQRGYGTRLLQRSLAQDLGPGASVELHFKPTGLQATFRFVTTGA
jgi:two-component sensor histidine kinase